jgi:hypothetical protein
MMYQRSAEGQAPVEHNYWKYPFILFLLIRPGIYL